MRLFREALFVISFAIGFGIFIISASAAPSNIIPNPSLETLGTGGNPANWLRGGWGTNSRVFTYPVAGQDGARAAKVEITAYTNGDAKWYFQEVPVTPGQTYVFSDFYISNVTSYVAAQLRMTNGTLTYLTIAQRPASPAGWTNTQGTFTVPSGVSSLTIFHVIWQVGFLTTDNFSLVENLIGNPSFETAGTGGNPANWFRGGWGSNTRTFTYPTVGADGNKAAKVQISSYVNGDAKWYHGDVPVVGGNKYTFTDSYKSSVPSELSVQYKTGTGTQYQYLAAIPAAAAWSTFSQQFTVPANATALSVFHSIYRVGSIETDAYSLSAAAPAVGIAIPGNTLGHLSDTELAATLDGLSSLGVQWLRFDIEWSGIQPTNSSNFTWDKIDRIVAAVNARNIKMLPILTYTPPWARSQGCNSDKCGPSDPAQFGAFAGAASARYAPQGIHSWEIWNEPNIGQFWQPTVDPVAYVRLLKAAYLAIKAKDATAIVVSGGLAPAATEGQNVSSTDFLTRMYSASARPYFDAVGYHPYSYPVLPSYNANWNGWNQIVGTNPSLRSIMSANGDAGKQIWLTEFGAPTNGPGVQATSDNYRLDESPTHVSEELQAKIAADAVRLLQGSSWAGPLFWYSYKDGGTDVSNTENFFGYLRYDGSRKPVYEELRKATIAR